MEKELTQIKIKKTNSKEMEDLIEGFCENANDLAEELDIINQHIDEGCWLLTEDNIEDTEIIDIQNAFDNINDDIMIIDTYISQQILCVEDIIKEYGKLERENQKLKSFLMSNNIKIASDESKLKINVADLKKKFEKNIEHKSGESNIIFSYKENEDILLKINKLEKQLNQLSFLMTTNNIPKVDSHYNPYALPVAWKTGTENSINFVDK